MIIYLINKYMGNTSIYQFCNCTGETKDPQKKTDHIFVVENGNIDGKNDEDSPSKMKAFHVNLSNINSSSNKYNEKEQGLASSKSKNHDHFSFCDSINNNNHNTDNQTPSSNQQNNNNNKEDNNFSRTYSKGKINSSFSNNDHNNNNMNTNIAYKTRIDLENDNYYEGFVLNNKYNGEGTLVVDNFMYVGEFKNGLMNGIFEVINLENTEKTFKGQYIDDMKCGKGKIIISLLYGLLLIINYLFYAKS